MPRENLKFCSINWRFHTGRVLRFAGLRVFDEPVPSYGDRKNHAGWSGFGSVPSLRPVAANLRLELFASLLFSSNRLNLREYFRCPSYNYESALRYVTPHSHLVLSITITTGCPPLIRQKLAR